MRVKVESGEHIILSAPRSIDRTSYNYIMPVEYESPPFKIHSNIARKRLITLDT